VFYCASKAALISATKSLAKELATDICVNSIAPGFIDIPEGYDQADIDRQLGFIPAHRKGSRDDITSAVRFLIENDYVTGEVIKVDGGRGI
jgi:pteridine reductase